MPERRTITAERRLRPIRLGFLVRPEDSASLHRVFQINTVLWGGSFNGIIPALRRLPKALKDRTRRTAREYTSGYLDAFLPDYLVPMEPGLAELVDFPHDRIIRPTDVLNAGADEPVGYGLDVRAVYETLYEREFKFLRRDPAEVVLPRVADSALALFGAACFGEFPEGAGLEEFKEYYIQAFLPSETEITAANLYETLRVEIINPRRIGTAEISGSRRGWRDSLTLFYMDGRSPLDVLDYWNLRALGWSVLPVPRQWAKDLRPACERLIAETYRPMPRNPDLMLGTMVQASRSVATEEVKAFVAGLARPGQDALSYSTWYPRIWSAWAREKDAAGRTELTAKRERDEVEVTDGSVTINTVSPPFAQNSMGRGTPRWVNVLEITYYNADLDAAPVLPPDLASWERLVRPISSDGQWITREGIILPCEFSGWNQQWTLPNAVEVMEAWMQERGYSLKISGAGRVAREVMRRLGRYGANLLVHREVLDLLNRMAHGGVELEVSEHEKGRRKAVSPAESHQRWFSLLKQVYGGRDERARGALKTLTERDVLRIGMRLPCSECAQYNWYPLSALGDELRCERCLRTFRFPSESPPRDAWYYRAVGPFATENYAQGSYCVALALRALTFGSHSQATWVPSFEMEKAGEPSLEADFGMFWSPHDFLREPAHLVFGECKSFHNPFTEVDISRMERLGRAFPGAVLAFCTLRDSLPARERRAIARLARAGRERLGELGSRNPVVILTAVELLGKGIPDCWNDTESVPKEAERLGYAPSLRRLADVTQQIHLGMQSYGAWQTGRYEKIRRRWSDTPDRSPI